MSFIDIKININRKKNIDVTVDEKEASALKKVGTEIGNYRCENDGRTPIKITVSPSFFYILMCEFKPYSMSIREFNKSLLERPANSICGIELVVNNDATEDVVMK